jgi:hypothetical protein
MTRHTLVLTPIGYVLKQRVADWGQGTARAQGRHGQSTATADTDSEGPSIPVSGPLRGQVRW